MYMHSHFSILSTCVQIHVHVHVMYVYMYQSAYPIYLMHYFVLIIFQIAGRLQQTVHGLGDASIQLARDGAIVQSAPDDKVMKRSLMDQARIVTEKVMH